MKLLFLTILFAAICWLPAGSVLAQKAAPPKPPACPAPVTKPEPAVDEDENDESDRDDDVDKDKDKNKDKDQNTGGKVRLSKDKVTLKKDRVELSKHRVQRTTSGDREQTIPAMPSVVISFCGGASNVTIRGWDRNEVHARVESGEVVELRSNNAPKMPASRIEVNIPSNIPTERSQTCHSSSDLTLDVPRSAIVEVKTDNGDIDAENIARVRADSLSGKFNFRGIGKAIDATSFNGDIMVERAHGPLNVRAISGSIEVRDAGPLDTGDGLTASSVSGELSLSNCTFARARINSVTGDLTWTGSLAGGGRYDVSTTNGDITLVMPANSSFHLDAKVAAQGAVITDFLLRSEGETSFKKLAQQVTGVYGSGSAWLNLTTFNGTIRLRKKL